ncbi:hypothetical protein LOAG_07902 [Loa loa]|uniref:Uncharacterized protein n=1 Tax=Loa loa TaxID=7209 RepID=A0A1S0TV30_LOALO|nr:hypothetical protein LOAG_07902 [Loa loa]EFO20589.1 hypothetical protein LOAG_07902 [Loa loa]
MACTVFDGTGIDSEVCKRIRKIRKVLSQCSNHVFVTRALILLARQNLKVMGMEKEKDCGASVILLITGDHHYLWTCTNKFIIRLECSSNCWTLLHRPMEIGVCWLKREINPDGCIKLDC